MPREADRRRAVLSVSARVGKRIEVDGSELPVLHSAHAHLHFHLVARGRSRLGLLPAEDQHAGLFCLPGDKGGISLRDRRLFCPEAAADPRLHHPHHGFRDAEGVGDDAPAVEQDLGGADHIQAPGEGVDAAVRPESLHHGLLHRLRVEGVLHHNVALREDPVHVALAAALGSDEIPPAVPAAGDLGIPVVLRVDQDLRVLCFMHVEDRRQDLVLHFYQLQRAVHALFIRPGHDRRDISRVAHPAVQHKTITGTQLRRGLTCQRVARHVLRHVLPGEYRLDARHLHRSRNVDLLDQRAGVGGAQQLHHQVSLRDHVLQIDRLPCHKLHRVFFPHRRIHHPEVLHDVRVFFMAAGPSVRLPVFLRFLHQCVPSFLFFHAR